MQRLNPSNDLPQRPASSGWRTEFSALATELLASLALSA